MRRDFLLVLFLVLSRFCALNFGGGVEDASWMIETSPSIYVTRFYYLSVSAAELVFILPIIRAYHFRRAFVFSATRTAPKKVRPIEACLYVQTRKLYAEVRDSGITDKL